MHSEEKWMRTMLNGYENYVFVDFWEQVFKETKWPEAWSEWFDTLKIELGQAHLTLTACKKL